MINCFIIGDLHGDWNPVRNHYKNYIQGTPLEQDENWLICLGDFGALYYMDYRDRNYKKNLHKLPYKYFVIRGNHEQRAENCCKAEPAKWEELNLFEGKVLREKEFPNIYYANDSGGIYNILGRKSLIVPGSYSVDKWYRLQQGWNWFPDEQLTAEEMAALEEKAKGQHFNLVLSHTCPWSKMPTDLFLSCIDQSTVDNSMERWMEKFLAHTSYDLHFWGHYHSDRIEAPYCEMFYHEVENLEDIEARWTRYTETGELDWWLPKAPTFHMYED